MPVRRQCEYDRKQPCLHLAMVTSGFKISGFLKILTRTTSNLQKIWNAHMSGKRDMPRKPSLAAGNSIYIRLPLRAFHKSNFKIQWHCCTSNNTSIFPRNTFVRQNVCTLHIVQLLYLFLNVDTIKMLDTQCAMAQTVISPNRLNSCRSCLNSL